MKPSRLLCIMGLSLAVAVCCAPRVARAVGTAEPDLPAGLGEGHRKQDGEPDLPTGIEDGDKKEPDLPAGMADADKARTKPAQREKAKLPKWLDLAGFWEIRGGVRTQRDKHQRDASIGETRLHLEGVARWQKLTFRITPDFLYDPVLDHHTVRLESGGGWLDLREASVEFSPFSFMDVKAGRQILTWGTGDLLFLNDMFPKDWKSFFIGRDDDYLKAPSDALKISFFSDLANVDAVYVPRFDPDRFIEGRRLSYWSGNFSRQGGRDAVVEARLPDKWFSDQEWHTRVYRTLGGYELAAYGYWGYWKSPAGSTPIGHATFPRLSVYGGSARGQLGRGIANFEAAYYDSRQDRSGSDPGIRNSEWRLLAGYEQDLPRIARDLNVGVQYYVELMDDYNAYQRALPPRAKEADHARQVLTFRVTKLLMNQNLKLSFFAYYSPTDSDAYLRPKISYKIDDHWTAELGGNVFFGTSDHTFFGQFEKNTNVYAALRYGF